MNKAVFLDRDETILLDKGYMHDIKDIEFLPNAIEGLKEFQKKDYKLIIVTNQSGIGRGYFKEEKYLLFRDSFHKMLEEKGVHINKEYYCKHPPEENCACRKPNTALLEKAVAENSILVEKSFFIGDKASDIEAGKRIGCKTILIKKNEDKKDTSANIKPDFVCNDLFEASLIV